MKNNNVNPVDWNGNRVVVGAKVKQSPMLVFGEFYSQPKEGVVEEVEIEQGSNNTMALVQWEDEPTPVLSNTIFLEMV
tara:strand:+ start:1154 stop:1387 length:234 start_codon:yes stop_codon:yes gene_type:complete